MDAIPFLAEAYEQKIGVPTELALIGYDNSSVAMLPLVNLSSIEQDTAHLGKTVADLMLSRINGRTRSEHVKIQPSVVIRGSLEG
ncbi:hypothetical protein AX760_13155 [Pararhizobium antarcticum]|uniref:Transcriptional regulator LacI/GalR-like sensor domain-containing protein n=1 Tax=Pararhizobium antarcticum TaxID=1798805 RepID=A0A657LVK0_9HYPH|nr:hypothetical protein AX761_17205 [Rhizobium sp. 58]OJF99426.1 hypothetical protein AX760_13155 [Pararhizobium antarcticum]